MSVTGQSSMPLSTTNKDMFVENSINNSVSEIPARCFAISILYEDCHCETPDTRFGAVVCSTD